MAGGFMSDNVREHPRDRAGLTYVYPVVSRRARGVSIGVNLNPNAHCNWRCVYCQVPGLQRGAGPEIDLELLRSELEGFLEAVTAGDWLEHFAPPEARRINDVAFSGDGESTTSPQFAECVDLVAECMARFGLLERGVKLVLITNGSMVGRGEVQEGLARLAEANGEVWFKFDGAREQDRLAINDVRIPDSRVRANLRTAAALARPHPDLRVCPQRPGARRGVAGGLYRLAEGIGPRHADSRRDALWPGQAFASAGGGGIALGER
ncbi:MAG: radical SAM protein [Planctomycetota bacterium]